MSSQMETLAGMFSGFCQGLPSDIPQYLKKEAKVCCRLHSASLPAGMPPEGCGGGQLGTHPAIVDFVQRGVAVCHAFPGQLVLDRLFAAKMYDADAQFFLVAYRRSASFRRRYFGGNPVGPSVYGAGYCYLRLMVGAVRSRVARILGPNPLVADVLRAYLLVGFPTGNSLVVRLVAPGQYHVANTRKSSDYLTIARQLESAVLADSDARVGMHPTVPGAMEVQTTQRDLGMFQQIVVQHNQGGVNVFTPGVGQLLGVEHGERASLLWTWFLEAGICLSDLDVDNLMIVTTAAAVLKHGGPKIMRDVVRVWAVLGDVELKRKMAQGVLAAIGTPQDYSVALQAQEKKMLSHMADFVRMSEFFDIGMLDTDSSAVASIVQAIVGYVSVVGGDICLQLLFRAMGYGLVSEPATEPVRLGEADCVLSLNSGQMEHVYALLRRGDL